MGVVDLERITLMSDGASIYECASPDEIIDLLAGGQGVFGIAIEKCGARLKALLQPCKVRLTVTSLVVKVTTN